MDYSELKAGDIVRVNQAARSKPVGFSSKRVDVPATTQVVRVVCISNVAGQPGRTYADCVVLVTESGEDLTNSQAYPNMRPSVQLYCDTEGQTFDLV